MSDVEKALKAKTQELTNVKKRLEDVQIELSQTQAKLVEKDRKIVQLQDALNAQTSKYSALEASLADITSKYTAVLEKYDALMAGSERPVVTPTNLANSFVRAIESTRKEIRMPEESPVDYRIGKFDVILKTGIGFDKQKNVEFWLPKIEEISPENLSTIQFSINAVPKLKQVAKEGGDK